MDDQRQTPESEEIRKRRLDALFADEPFLSPTMKARRLHEKLHNLTSQESAAVQAAPRKIVEDPPQLTLRERPAPPTPSFLPTPPPAPVYLSDTETTDTLSLAQACACLRDRSGALGGRAHEERLRRFRDEVLPKWLEGLPKPESTP